MSVSLSSVYEQTESLRQIEQKFEQAVRTQSSFQPLLSQIVDQARHLTMSQSYRLVVILSKNLNNNASTLKKYAALYLLKKLILTALHHFYIFISAKVLVWVFNMAKFEARKNQYERVKLYVKQLALKGNGDQVVQERQCYRLMKLVDQFLPWFSQNVPVHINAEFEFRSTFVRWYQQLTPKRPISSYQHFSPQDYKKFESSFTANKPYTKQHLKQLSEFLSLQVHTLLSQQKYKSDLLRQIVHTGDSHCIRTIIAELCSLLQDNTKLFYCLKLVEYLIVVGQVEFVGLVGMYVVPGLLGYLLPVGFVEGRRLGAVPLACSLSQEKCIIDFICIWAKITEKVGLSTKFYEQALKQIQAEKGNLLNVQQKHLGDFLTKVIDMEKINNDKRPHIQNQNQKIEQQLIKVLRMREPSHEPLRLTPQWQARASAINELNQFKESQVEGTGNAVEESTYAAIFKSPTFQQNTNINSNRNVNSPGKPIILDSNSLQMLTFKQIRSPDKQALAGQSPFKESIRVSKGNINGNGNGSVEQSSFMAFQASHMSKFSEYSVKKSREGENKLINTSGGLLKHQFLANSGAKNSVNNSKSQSVVYFDRSQDFHSQNSIKSKEYGQPQPPIAPPQKKDSKISLPSSKSLKIHEINEQSVSTYRFDSSNISRNSASNSSIQNFGKEALDFPESVPKPTFGFKRKDNNILVEENGRQFVYGDERILGSDLLVRNQRIGEGEFGNFVGLQSSEIQDLSGGKHNINESIRFSEGSEIGKREPARDEKGRVSSQKVINLGPNQEYFQSARLHLEGNNIQLKKTQNFGPSQNQDQRLASLSPNVLKKTPSQKHLLSSQNLLKFPNSQPQSPPQPQTRTLSNHNEQVHSQTPSKSTSNLNLNKKKHLIVDQFANDRLMQLEKQLGKAVEEKNLKEQELRKKENQYKLLKSKSIPYMGRKVETLKKEDQIIKILMGQKSKEDYNGKMGQYVKPIKDQNKLSDYFLENEVKGLYIPTSEPYDRTFTKQILGSRCLLLANEQLELGYNYSQIQNQVSFYLTFFKVFDTISVQVHQNSLTLQKPVNLHLQNQPAGYQLKLKRKVLSLKPPKKQPTFSQIINSPNPSTYTFPQLQITLSDQTGENLLFRTLIPCCVLNLAQPVEITNQIVEELRGRKVLRSQELGLAGEFVRNSREKVEKYFGRYMGLVDGWMLLGYRFSKGIFGDMENQYVKFKISKGKTVEFEIFGDPKSLLVQALTCILSSKHK